MATLCQLPEAEHRELVRRLNTHLALQEAALNPLDVAKLALADQAFHQEMYEAARWGHSVTWCASKADTFTGCVG